MSASSLESSPPQSVVEALRALARAHRADRIEIEEFAKGLGVRGYGFLCLILNIPNMIPLPIPGLSFVFGVPLAVVAVQLAMGLESPALPGFLRRKGLRRASVLRFIEGFDKRYSWAHRLVRPRASFLCEGVPVRIIGGAIFAMACVMAMPIPLGNLVLAIPIGLMCLGLIEKDGLFVVLGLVAGAFGLFVNYLLASAGLFLLMAAASKLWGG